MFLTVLALVTLTLVVAVAIECVWGLHAIENLADIPEDRSFDLPRVSIIVAARNEEKNIRKAVSSLTRLDYPKKQLIVVNDRSTDSTGEILRELASKGPGLRILSVTDLPKGWLGKNHALFVGAKASDGDLLLFTDADVVMEQSTLSRAVSYMNQRNIAHLAIGPQALMPGVLLNIFMAGFAVFFNLFTRPWRARDPKSSAHIGIGAFNLIRREAYEKIGTHQALAMRPDDDLKLGKLVKKYEFKQDFLVGAPLIQVEWYGSVRALIDGLMKNSFAGVDYKIGLIIGGSLAHLIFIVGPYLGVWMAQGAARFLCVGTIIILTAIGMAAARTQYTRMIYGLGLPLASLLFVYIIWKATLRTLWRGGIEWRGTFYPLEELRRNKI